MWEQAIVKNQYLKKKKNKKKVLTLHEFLPVGDGDKIQNRFSLFFFSFLLRNEQIL